MKYIVLYKKEVEAEDISKAIYKEKKIKPKFLSIEEVEEEESIIGFE